MTEQRKSLKDLFILIGVAVGGLSSFVGNVVQIKQAISGEPHWFWLLVFGVVTLIVCAFVFLKKTTVGERFGIGLGTRIHLFPTWSRLICGIIFVSVLAVTLCVLLFKPEDTRTFTILVADIDGPPQHRVTESLIEDLRKAIQGHTGIRIEALGKGVSAQEGSEVARKWGSEKQADVVVWGWYATSNTKLRVTLHFELLSADVNWWKSGTERTAVFGLSQLENFEVQKHLGDDLSSIALLLVAKSKMKTRDFFGAALVLTDAIGHLRDQGNLGEAADIYADRGSCYNSMQSIASSRWAIEDYSKAISLRTNFTEAYCNRAAAYLSVRMDPEGLADCDKVLLLEPNHPIALANRSAALINLGRFDEAVRDAQAACTGVPSFPSYRLCLAQALSAKGETDRALDECDFALRREPSNRAGRLLHANICRQGRRLDEAIREFTALLGEADVADNAYYGRGQTYWDKGEYRKAADDFGSCLKIATNSANAHASRAQMYHALGQHTLAIADCDFAVAASSNLFDVPLQNVYCLRGQAYADLGNFSAATTNFTQAIQLNPQYVQAYEGRARALMTQRDFTNALEDLSRIIDVETNSSYVFYNRGMVYLQLNMLSNAVANFNTSLSLDTNSAEAFCFRGTAYAGLNLHSNAIVDLSASISRSPTNMFAYGMRGISYWALGELSEALRDCRVSMQETNEPVAMQNTARLWDAILEIGQNPTNRENLRALNGQPTAEQRQIQELLIGAKGGRLADYDRLGELSNATNVQGLSAQAAVADVLAYFETYRDRMFLKRKFFMEPAMLNLMPLSVDEVVFNQLRSPTWSLREAAVFYLAETRKSSVVPHLCDALSNETNLYVASDITKALNAMTGTDHGPLAMQSVKDWWSSHNRDKAYQSTFAVSQRYWNVLTMPADQARQALGPLSQTIDAEPAAYWTRCFRAGCYIVLHDYDLAEKDLAEVEKGSPRLSWFMFYRTMLHYARGKPEQVESLNELLSLYPAFEANARQISGTNVTADPRIKWPQKQILQAKPN